jgi:dCMP deaminase
MKNNDTDWLCDKMERQLRWDMDYLALAKFWGLRKSKDPSTKVGAVLVSPRNTVVALGYNGFPRGIADTPERLNDRPTKYMYTVHGELNAILTSAHETSGCSLYCWPVSVCSRCAPIVIQAGIVRIVSPPPAEEDYDEVRLGRSDYALAKEMLDEAGIAIDHLDV